MLKIKPMTKGGRAKLFEAIRFFERHLIANMDWEIQYLDAKEANELVVEYRLRTLETIQKYKIWMTHMRKHRALGATLFSIPIRDQYFRDRIRSEYRAYRDMQRKAQFLTDAYLEQLRRKTRP